jgi:NAD dependent epimerase/dehydratase family enzyme
MADSLLLGGQRVLPARAQRQGFQFRFATIESALRRIFSD